MRKAFTITEIIVAITVFSIGVIGLAGFFAVSAQMTRHAGSLSVASNLAAGLIDEELNITYDSLINVSKTRVSIDSADPYYNYYKEITISYVDGMTLAPSVTDTGLKKIDIFVYYYEGATEKNVQTATLKTRL